jgi:hypothetical protein
MRQSAALGRCFGQRHTTPGRQVAVPGQVRRQTRHHEDGGHAKTNASKYLREQLRTRPAAAPCVAVLNYEAVGRPRLVVQRIQRTDLR